MSKNPFHRFTLPNGKKTDINIRSVREFTDLGNSTTRLTFFDGSSTDVQESAQTVRGRTRKTWPEETGDVSIDPA